MNGVRAYIGLGANLGPALDTLRAAAARIAQWPGAGNAQTSSIWRSAPLDASGPDFLNAALALDTTLSPLALLDALRAIEAEHGRERPYRNAPRTLDLDLLLYGELTLNHPRLELPHPRLHLRRFVLAPLVELDPALRIPGRGAARALLDAISDQVCARTEFALLPERMCVVAPRT